MIRNWSSKFWGDDDFNEHTSFFPTEIIFKTIGFEINPSGSYTKPTEFYNPDDFDILQYSIS